jgi:hypothetical protein
VRSPVTAPALPGSRHANLIPAWNTPRIGPEATQALGETVEAVGRELDGAGNAEGVRNLIVEQIIGAANREACPQSACGGRAKPNSQSK